MNFSAIRVILVATSHPGNIGSSARAIKTMGLDRLYLVAPKAYPHAMAHAMAAGADDILEKCIVVDTLAQALHGCKLAIATSARRRQIDLPLLNPKAVAELVACQSDVSEIALVFGREDSGLSNTELLQCQFHATIPTNPDYSSLNLAQAVQVMPYELRMASLQKTHLLEKESAKLASIEEVELFYQHLSQVMQAINFLKIKNPKRLEVRLRRLFNRVRLEHMEVNILRGILSHIQDHIQRREDGPYKK